MSRLSELADERARSSELYARINDNVSFLDEMTEEEVRLYNLNSSISISEIEIAGVKLKDLYLFFADLSKSKRQKLFDETGIDTDLYFFNGAHCAFYDRTLTEKQYASLGRVAEAYKKLKKRKN